MSDATSRYDKNNLLNDIAETGRLFDGRVLQNNLLMANDSLRERAEHISGLLEELYEGAGVLLFMTPKPVPEDTDVPIL